MNKAKITDTTLSVGFAMPNGKAINYKYLCWKSEIHMDKFQVQFFGSLPKKGLNLRIAQIRTAFMENLRCWSGTKYQLWA